MNNLMKRNPFNSFVSLDKAFNNLLKLSMFEDNDWFKTDWLPEADIIENEKEVKVQLDCLGMSLDDLNVSIENNILTVKGERKSESKKEEENNFYKTERSYGTFIRSFSLPIGIEPDSIKAEYKDGVVAITGLKNEATKPRNIQIQASEETKPKSLSASG